MDQTFPNIGPYKAAHPTLYWIESPFPGKLAISARPRGGDWLEDEVVAWQRAGIQFVVSLLTSEEVQDLDLSAEPRLSKTHSISFLSLPIPDRSVPPSRTEVTDLVRKLRNELEVGHNVMIHCRQGIGRSSLIAAAVLISGGVDPAAALHHISEARGVPVPETPAQHDWILHFTDYFALHDVSRT